MPGKVNPVIPEMVNQVAFRIVGADATVTLAAESGQLQLNAFEPVMADALLESLQWLTAACKVLRERCIDGIEANEEFLTRRMSESLSVVTGLTPYLGYTVAAGLVKMAAGTVRSLRELVTEQNPMSAEELADALSPMALAGLPARRASTRCAPRGGTALLALLSHGAASRTHVQGGKSRMVPALSPFLPCDAAPFASQGSLLVPWSFNRGLFVLHAVSRPGMRKKARARSC